ncbi:TonB-dependent receptor domain-containing protein [Lysobacter sp. HA35]
MSRNSTIVRSRLTTALLAALLLPTAALAQSTATTTSSTSSDDKKTTELDKVVVTGSLIPQTDKETFKPVTVITAEDLQARGYTSVADALQQSSFATGGVQGNQTSASFTQGAETLSLFGLSASYVKYLIDGRPMANYPALYNGSDVFNNISGIPVDLVDRIEILPGGQSSLYGSDAIAGVINIILKKHIDGATLSARIGGYEHGGGASRRVSFADTFGSKDGRFNTLFGVQLEKTDPVYASQRDLTDQYNQNGHDFKIDPATGKRSIVAVSPAVASRDFLVYSAANHYYFLDPNNCSNLTNLFDGTEGFQKRASQAEPYCGSFYTPGYRTLKNGKSSGQVYAHSTFDLNDHTQLYGDFLYTHEKVKYNTGSNYLWWGTGAEWGYYYDPALDDFVNLQRAFAPEEIGGWGKSHNQDTNKSYALTLGVNGTIGDSDWDYDVGLTRTEYKLNESSLARLGDPINQWFLDHVLGPQQGLDPYYGAYPVFTPDYAAFYTPMTPADFDSFTTRTNSHSRTYDNMLRAQVTNGSLFSLPGGDAGIAVAVEAGNQGWAYNPDPLLLNGDVWGTTAVSGGGQRSRYAVTGEMRLPIFAPLTLSASARYDSYHVANENVAKPTYSLGLEYRPVQSLLLRGQYGTAFKAPTLADQFQGLSGFYSQATDYYRCHVAGFEPGNTDACPYDSTQYFGQQSGNPDLEPINADVWSYGVVWAPTAKFSIGADYHHWSIDNEVSQQSVDQLLRDELACRTGQLDATSGTCVAALGQITRGPQNNIDSIFVKKVNVSNETLNAVTVDTHYGIDLGAYGNLHLNGNWTRNLKHQYQQYPTDPSIDVLNNPYWSTDPKYKADVSASWNKNQWTTTVYANYIGPTPNYLASLTSAGYAYSPYAAKLGSYTLLNASVNYEVNPALTLSLMVNNLADRMPDMDWTYPGTSSAPYNSYNFNPMGRAFYLEARYQFGKK